MLNPPKYRVRSHASFGHARALGCGPQPGLTPRTGRSKSHLERFSKRSERRHPQPLRTGGSWHTAAVTVNIASITFDSTDPVPLAGWWAERFGAEIIAN